MTIGHWTQHIVRTTHDTSLTTTWNITIACVTSSNKSEGCATPQRTNCNHRCPNIGATVAQLVKRSHRPLSDTVFPKSFQGLSTGGFASDIKSRKPYHRNSDVSVHNERLQIRPWVDHVNAKTDASVISVHMSMWHTDSTSRSACCCSMRSEQELNNKRVQMVKHIVVDNSVDNKGMQIRNGVEMIAHGVYSKRMQQIDMRGLRVTY